MSVLAKFKTGSAHQRLGLFRTSLSASITEKRALQSDIVIICGKGKKRLYFSGLPILACLSPIVRVAAELKNEMVSISLPDFEVESVKKALLLLSNGEVAFEFKDLEEVSAVVGCLGFSVSSFSPYNCFV